MLKITYFVLIFSCFSTVSLAQHTTKGSFYLYWGYNRSAYTPSDIHLADKQNYDLTLHQVKARDMPPKRVKDLLSFYAPYNYRVGYQWNNQYAISLGMDHMKYKTVADQIVRVDGYVHKSVSTKYEGQYHQDKLALTQDLFRVEHSDGLNYISLEIDRQLKIHYLVKDKLKLLLYAGIGAGIMIPRTESYLFNRNGGNHPFHLSGYGVSMHAYPRLYWGKTLFFQATTKIGFINMPDVYSDTKLGTQDKFSQHFFFMQGSLVIGARIAK